MNTLKSINFSLNTNSINLLNLIYLFPFLLPSTDKETRIRRIPWRKLDAWAAYPTAEQISALSEEGIPFPRCGCQKTF